MAIAVVVSIIVSAALYKPLYAIAITKGFFKKVNGRSSHNGKVPDFGGIMLFAALYFSFTALVQFPHKEMQYVLLGLTTLWGIGLYDDILEMRAKYKLFGEILTSLFIIFGGGLYFTNFYGFLGIYEVSPYIGIPFTLFMMVGIINAINMIDGIDGLCSGISAIILSAFSIWFFMNGYYNYSIIGFTTVGALGPFFCRNVICTKSKIFLGDNGSLILGLLISVFAIKFSELSLLNNKWLIVSNAPGVAFALLTIPVLDTIRLIVTRAINKRSPFRPDKEHIHHKLLTIFRGSHKKSMCMILLLQLSFVVLGFIGGDFSNELIIIASISVYTAVFVFLYIYATSIEKKEINLNNPILDK